MKNMIQGLPFVSYEDHFCEGYNLGKQYELSIPINQD